VSLRVKAIGKRAKRAIYSPAKNAGDSHGSPRSLAAQKALARDDNAVTLKRLLGMTVLFANSL
jgi:hypothetical protein